MTEPSALWPVLTLTFGLMAWGATVRFRRGPVLSPFSLSLLMLIAIFGVRPLLMLRYDDFGFYGRDVVTGFNAAARAGLLATVVLCVGYWVSLATRTCDAHTARPDRGGLRRQPPGIIAATVLCFGSVAGWFLVMIYLGGGIGFLPVLFGGRSPYVYAVLGQLPSAVFCLPIAAAAVLASARIQICRERRFTIRESVMFWLSVAVTTVPATSLGVRRFILPVVLMALVAVVHPRWNQRVTPTMAAFTTAILLVLAAIPFVRSAGARSGETDFLGALGGYFGAEGLLGTVKSFFVSYDTEGFAYVSYVAPRLGEGLPYGYGRGTVGDALLNPLPASFGMPTWADQQLTSIFGSGCDTTGGGQCPIGSIVGILLFDFGSAGVFAGCLALGFFFARFDRAVTHARSYGLLAVLVVAGFAPVFTRGSSMSTAWLGENVFVLAALMYWIVGRRAIGSSTLRSGAEHPVPAGLTAV